MARSSKNPWHGEVMWTLEDGRAESRVGELLRVGPRMAKLALQEEVPLNQQCTLKLRDSAGNEPVNAAAVVHFLRVGRSGLQISFRFERALSEEVLEQLRQAGLYERREKTRQSISLEAPAWPELNAAAEPISVRIVDLSRGGCCVKSPVPVPVGHRLTVFAGDREGPGEVVRLRVMWQQPSGDEFLLGCAFIQEADSRVLATLAPPLEAGLASRGRRLLEAVLGGSLQGQDL